MKNSKCLVLWGILIQKLFLQGYLLLWGLNMKNSQRPLGNIHIKIYLYLQGYLVLWGIKMKISQGLVPWGIFI